MSLGELEQQIMEIIWREKELSIRSVLQILNTQKPVAYTTVATIMQRLVDKKFLVRREKGKSFVYASRYSKELFSRKIVQSFLDKVVSSYGDIAIASFVDSIDDLPREKKEYFLKLLKQHENK